MKRSIILIISLLALLLLAACTSEPQTVVVTVPVVTEVEVTATAVPTAIPSDTPEPIEPTATTEPLPEPTKTLSPVMATQQAMLALMPTRAPSTPAPQIADDDYVALINQACGIVRDNYVRDNYNGVDWEATCTEYATLAESIDSQEAYWDLMSAFIGELNDNHSRYVPPSRFAAEFDLLDLPGAGSGRPWAGMTIWPSKEDEQLMIWYVCEFGAAADAGLQRGDVILAINGETIEYGEYIYVINQLLYANEDGASLTVQRGPDREPEEIEITFGGAGGCDGWQVALLSETPRIGYVRIPDFGGDSDTNLLTAIEHLEEDAPLDGLIVDIRHNPGGNSDRDIAIFTEGEFGKTGSLRADSTLTTYRIRGPVKWNEETPLAVLIDGNSHSAADYFAAAMKVSGRATLVGMPSAGNTEGINSWNLADGTVIRLAWMTLVLPDGNTIEGTGIIPDIQVPLGDWGLREVPDVQLMAAYEALTE